jgi:hypothetical protein
MLKRRLGESATTGLMSRLISSPDPCFIGRMGGTECVLCWRHIQRATFMIGIDFPYDSDMKHNAQQNAGVTPVDDKSIDQFASVYLGALPFADLLGVWDARGMYEIVDRFAAHDVEVAALDHLEPWSSLKNSETPWTHALAGQSVLVVHPFATSISAQFSRRKDVKTIKSILPDFELQTLIPPVTFASSSNGRNWLDNYTQLCAQVGARKFDVAIIGCGSYGLPLAAFVKNTGRKAVHLGGATQLLFGIRGKRWEEFPSWLALMDETWVRPLPSETPPGSANVEGACYW